MNKKLAMIGVGVAVGSIMLISSVYAGIGDAPGYQAYKSAIKETATVDNVTHKVNVSVTDNGKSMLQVDSTLKADMDDQAGSAEVTLKSGGVEQSIQFYSQDDQQIMKTGDSDIYRIFETDNDHADFKKHGFDGGEPDEAFKQEVENVIDALVGNLKNYVTLEEAGTDKDISLHLSGSQISPVVNTIGSLLIREGGRHHEEQVKLDPSDTFGVNVSSIKDSMPKLTNDIKIESVQLDAKVNADNRITHQAAAIEITGKDSQGIDHEVIVKLSMGLSDFDSTVPDTVDLTGKQVEKVNIDEEGHKGWKHK
jgi:hypothetical protein